MISNSSHYRGNIWKGKIRWERLGPREEYVLQRFLLLWHISNPTYVSKLGSFENLATKSSAEIRTEIL